MTDPRSELERLVAEWRREEAENRREMEEAGDGDDMSDADAEGLLARWNAYRKCADQLSAILQRSPQQEGERPETKEPT